MHGLINKRGEVVLPCVFKEVDYFGDDVVVNQDISLDVKTLLLIDDSHKAILFGEIFEYED